jgi:hypothetical protein
MIVSLEQYLAWKGALSQVIFELQQAMNKRKQEKVTAESADLILFAQRLKQLWFDLDRLEKRAARQVQE